MNKLSKNAQSKTDDVLNFPDLSSVNKEHSEVSFVDVVRFSEELLPFKNKNRKKSPAAKYTPFKLK